MLGYLALYMLSMTVKSERSHAATQCSRAMAGCEVSTKARKRVNHAPCKKSSPPV